MNDLWLCIILAIFAYVFVNTHKVDDGTIKQHQKLEFGYKVKNQ